MEKQSIFLKEAVLQTGFTTGNNT